MKKLIISLFTISLVLSVSYSYACGTCGCQDTKETTFSSEVQSTEVATKSCDKKENKSCCKKTKSNCNKSKKGSFNFTKSNNYGEEKSSCSSKTEKKGCCKKKANETKEASAEEAAPSDK
tara:strand:- start:128 stop:487 length:360 start_codon:yes stop_codon:yes gene_type:complete